MNSQNLILVVLVSFSFCARAQQTPASPMSVEPPVQQLRAQQAATQPVSTKSGTSSPQSAAKISVGADQVIDQIITREHALIHFLESRTPIVETYLQNFKPDAKLGAAPTTDQYFLGHVDLREAGRRDYLAKQSSVQEAFSRLFKLKYQPIGFSWMMFADRYNFDRSHYDFSYVQREFLGDVRCLVFDVEPKKGSGTGRFEGRIWVEDRDYNMVRFNGTYVPRPKNAYFFHMDSWRLNLVSGYWVPAYIYSEEGDFSSTSRDSLAFKAQSRIWGYDLRKNIHEDQLTDLKVDAARDESPVAQDASPIDAQRQWQQQAENNVLDRLQAAGLLAPPGEVDKVLQTVVNNILVTNNLDVPRPVRVRVMLTTPLETFSVGYTIVISRGFLDTLPDEASLAAILSHELGHIVLGHDVGTQYAFNDRMRFSDEATYQTFAFRHNSDEEAAADTKAIELLKNSPYAQKLGSAGLYLKQIQAYSPALSALLTAHLGNSVVDQKGQVIRLAALMSPAPQLDDSKLDQITALPLGGRIKLDPWQDHVEMAKAAPIAIASIRDKVPLEVTPFFPRLTRYGAGTGGSTGSQSTATSEFSK